MNSSIRIYDLLCFIGCVRRPFFLEQPKKAITIAIFKVQCINSISTIDKKDTP